MRSVLVIAAIVAALAALALPPHATAVALAGEPTARLALVERGVWILKLLLGLHAIGALTLRRIRPARGEFEPLLALRGGTPDRPTTGEQALVVGLILLAGALRLHDLGDQIWFDEIDTLVHYVRKPLGYVFTTFDSQNQHLLYSILARLCVVAFGESNAALRLPAAIFGVASLWALWNFARQVADRREALFAVALLTVSFHHLWFSQNARGYTGLLFFTVLGSTAFLRMLTSREWRGWGMAIAYGVCMSLAIATHVTALFAVAAHGLIWIALAIATRAKNVGVQRWMPALGFATTASFALLAYALVLPQFPETMLHKSMPMQSTEWKSTHWMLNETLSGLARGVPGGWLALAQGVLILGIGVWSYWRQSFWLLAIYLLGAVVTAAAIVALHHNLWPRFFFFNAGFFVLILFRGVFTLFDWLAKTPLGGSARTLGLLAAILLCIASAATLPRAWGPKQDYEGPIAYLKDVAEPGDAIATVEMTNLPYQELFHRDWKELDSLADLEALEKSHPHTWVVYTTPIYLDASQPDIWRRLQTEYAEAKVFPGTYGGSEVFVRVRR